MTVGLLLQDNFPLKPNESLLSWLPSFWPILEKSKGCIYVQYARFWIWDCHCPWVSETDADPVNLSRFLFFTCLPSCQVGKHDEAWMILKQIHDTNMRARGQPEKVFTVSVCLSVCCLGCVSGCLKKQRGLYSATTGTGFNTFTMQDHIWITKALKAVLCRSGLFAAWAALWESLLVNMFLELMVYFIHWLKFDFYYSHHEL